ncbi:outer membrane beta-barrel protein (plasmid) [Lichenicola cladoniae]|uniref:Outer membrane beta-barrel protein n=2 Tax=Lichenicola cladoniae TaxID=1484109 RepID=A0A6M8HZS7_9PROT|nr:outer membrane beta-barrel protein [Acetobacteraceae bacterium]QKE93591.1 outer membrane beta-barrel protein [Lichenicola cladoniae]
MLYLGVGTCAMRMTVGKAFAFDGASPITFDAGPLGPLQISGGMTGYTYALSGTGDAARPGLLGTDRSFGDEFLNGLIRLRKSDGLIQFTVQMGSTTSLTLGTEPSRSSVQTLSTGPLYAGSLIIAPTSNFKISAGLVGSVEGYESTLDWNNTDLLTTDIFYVQNSKSVGVTATYKIGAITVKAIFGDGFDTGVWNFAQALVTYTLNSDNSLNIYGASNLGRTNPGAHFYGSASLPYSRSFVGSGPTSAAALVNSNMIGAYYSFTKGNLTLVPEVQYVYAKIDHKIGLDKASGNLGAALFADYKFGKSPWSIGAWAECFSSNGPDLWFINPRSKGVGLSISPTWQRKYLFVRASLGVLRLIDIGDGIGYGSKGSGRDQATAALGAGFLF